MIGVALALTFAAPPVATSTPSSPASTTGTSREPPCVSCRLDVPTTVADAGPPGFPLLVTLHGDGQSATVLHDAWAPEALRRGLAVLSLQCPVSEGCRGSWWRWNGSPTWITDRVADVKARVAIDASRVALLGWSGGASWLGYRTQDFGGAFAAFVVHGGGMAPARSVCGDPKVPVYFLVGSSNPLHALAGALRAHYEGCGHEVLWDRIPGADHAGEWRSLADHRAAVFDWLGRRAVARNVAAPSASPGDGGVADAARITPAVPTRLACLTRAYGGTATLRADGWWLDVAASKVPYRDAAARAKGDADLRATFDPPYDTGAITPVVDVAHDPGRARVEALFALVYGPNPQEVEKSLVAATLLGRGFRVHARIVPALRRVDAKLALAAAADPAVRRAFAAPGGAYNWRTIAGSTLRSTHSWGIAIDVDPSVGDYWRNVPEARRRWQNRVPEAIVRAFESEGFVWGGRWGHFDTMHFEYRPELTDPSCLEGALRANDLTNPDP
ncbi:MAG: M15 family metallopeptidase [Polyangiaceae bacterium]